MQFSRRVVTAATLLASYVSGFGVNPAVMRKPQAMRTSKVVLFGIRCENKYYQLEEMEDKDNCTTELFLLDGGNVEFGETDGPLWTAAAGQWQVIPGTDDFKMDIVRKYSTGSDGRDMGEFAYEIIRSFVGEMTNVGDCVGIAGVMHSDQNLAEDNQEVGFFSMIDGTEDRQERRADARVGTKDSDDEPATPDYPQYDQPPSPVPIAEPPAQQWPQEAYAQQPQQPAQTAPQGWPQEAYAQPQQPAQTSPQGWPQEAYAQPQQPAQTAPQGWPQEAYTQPQQPAQQSVPQGWPQPPPQQQQQQQYGGQEAPPAQPNPEWPQEGQAPPAPVAPPSTNDWPKYGY